MKRLLSSVGMLALLGATMNVFAVGLIIVPEQDGWRPPVVMPPIWPRHPPAPPRPWPPPTPHAFSPLEITSAKVTARIQDQVAVTTVDQEFYNPNAARLEGTFLFPVPKGAQLDRFSMEIDGKKVEAELLAADKARGIYENIVRQMRDPALLEYSDQDVFKVRIFPIEPRSPKRITLSYTQLLKSDSGLVGYSLPLGTEKYSAKPVKNVSVKVTLETKRPLKTIYSPSHAVEVRRDGPQRATAGYEAANVQPDADFTLYFAPEPDEIGVNLLAHRTAGEDGYFLLLAAPGVELKTQPVQPKDVAFVLDTSGSMAGNKLEQAKKALQFCVENLNDGDRFEILRFSTEVEPLFGKLTEAAKPSRAKADDFIRGLKPIGGTAIDDALQKVLGLARSREFSDENNGLAPLSVRRPFVVIFLTDGRPTIGTTDENQILARVKKDAGSTRVFVFGLGTDVNPHLLDKITDATRAFSQYVLPEEDLEVKVSSFFAKIKDPVLANPTLTFTGDIRTTKLYPSPLPDLFRGDQVVLVGRYSGQGDSAAVLEGTMNGSAKKFTYEVKFPATASEHDFIPRLWATRRVGWLLDEIRLHGENAELKDEVTDLARKYGIVTPYTAYLIVEDEGRRNVPLAMQSMSQLRADRPALALANQAFDGLAKDKSGDAAVSVARYSMGMRKAGNVAEASTVQRAEANRRSWAMPAAPLASGASVGSVAKPDAEAADRVTQYSQQQRFVAGRNFFQNGSQWVDSEVQKNQAARRVRVQFNSPEYFDLLRKQSQSRSWLALGNNVQFVLDGTIYEIYDDTGKGKS
jgi:Ca-activated chloride channel family protein